ncbi:MAG: aspartate carbamoyltransferase catalytic subunit [Synergistaceae bacterium]|jgi:aspartate carbamoyltransferase catalytic subunit|nr:aspartate carbamoyltransferase catalytic subunit [Synergistaceae bacterium]
MLRSKDLLGLRETSAEEIHEILNTAELMKVVLTSNNKKTPHLQGRSIITVFYENSTRTRMSFELACKFMSGTASNISASASSVAKGETLIDTARTLDVMGTDVMILRHPMTGAPHLMARNVKSAVINAGDGVNEHPTQALLDMYTMREKLGGLKGLRVAIIGDVRHSRVARSNIYGLTKMGASVVVSGPPTLMLPELESLGAEATDRTDDAIRGADVVMGLRIQLERQKKGLFPSVREYHRFFGLTEERVALARKGALIMHPGPVNRGVEIATEVADSPESVIDEQVTNGVAVRMALLFLLTRQKPEAGGIRI